MSATSGLGTKFYLSQIRRREININEMGGGGGGRETERRKSLFSIEIQNFQLESSKASFLWSVPLTFKPKCVLFNRFETNLKSEFIKILFPQIWHIVKEIIVADSRSLKWRSPKPRNFYLSLKIVQFKVISSSNQILGGD